MTIHDRLAVWLTWEDVGTSYILERSLAGAGGPWVEMATLPPGADSFTDQELQDNVTYFYRVKARTGVGDSPYSNVVSAVATALPVPSPAK
jgi:titin